MKNILVIGHGQHGKDTVAEFIEKYTGYSFMSSSMAACEYFLYDKLKDIYSYNSLSECFIDRHNHRTLWHDEIEAYNTPDRTRLARQILKTNEIYVGMRNSKEYYACKEQKIFDAVIGVYDPRKPIEPEKSFNIDMWRECDFVIMNNTTLQDLEDRVRVFCKMLEPVGEYNERYYI